MTDAVTDALDVARELARAGVPLFLAAPDETAQTGFALPHHWQETTADPSVVDAWQPGMALCAVMGHGLDLIDIDPRNGGDLSQLDCELPRSYAAAATPSGGVHSFIASIGVRSKNNVKAGIDVKSGDADGKGRGFAFLPPTVRMSKVDGHPRRYVWGKVPDVDRLRREGPTDDSGAGLAALVRAARGEGVVPGGEARGEAVASIEEFMRTGPWADVAATLAGGRNDGVMKLAAALRGRGGWRLDDAIAYMDAVVWPVIDQDQAGHAFSREEYLAAINSVWERYADGAVTRMEEATDSVAERPPALNSLGLLEGWFVERIHVQRLAGRFRWSSGLGWMAWDGARWKTVDRSVVVDDVRQYVIWLHGSVVAAGGDADLVKKVSALGNKTKLGNLIELCQGMDGVRARAEDFDAHPDLLNVRNGVVDLRTGELSPHDPELLMTKIAGCDYVPGAAHADWDAALAAVPDDVHEWYQVRMGQAATGHMTPDDTLLVQVGGGENGKTTVMTGLRGALGGFFLDVSHRALLASSDSVPTELMDFHGARLALLEETPEARRLEVVKLKALIGTPTITARRMRRDPITFAATHSLFLSTNYLPVVQEVDHGTWRRLAALRFPYRFRGREAELVREHDRRGDPGLRERIRLGETGQHEAVLAWLVDGARKWYAAGKVMPTHPERVLADTREWRAGADLIWGWLDERMIFDANRHVMSSELLDDINEYLTGQGHRPWSKQLLTSRLEGHSEITGRGVKRRKIKRQEGLSQRPARPGAVTTSDIPSAYWAWMGLRFRDDHDEGSYPQVVDNREMVGSARTKVDLLTCEVPEVPKLSFPTDFASRDQQGFSLWGTANFGTSGTHDQQLINSNGHTESSEPDAPRREMIKAQALEVDSAVLDTAPPRAPVAIVLDLETGDAKKDRYDTDPRAFVRLAGLNADGTYYDTTDIPAVAHAAGNAELLVGHNLISFDLPVLDAVAPGSIDLLELTRCRRVLDTMVTEAVLDPPEVDERPNAVARAAARYRLNAIAERRGLPGKTDRLDELAKHHGGYDAIPVDDPRYRAYLRGDVDATRALADAQAPHLRDYVWREHRVAAIAAIMSDAGLAVDMPLLQDRYWRTRNRKADLTRRLAQRYGLPTVNAAGKPVESAHATKEGKAALVAAFADLGVDDADLPRTDKGAYSFGGDGMRELARKYGGEVAELCDAVADMAGARTVYATALEHTHADGRVHPQITMYQASGRWSVTKPGLTVFGKRGGRVAERAVFRADDGNLLLAADLSQIDARAVAAHCQDPAYLSLFEPGVDSHTEVARMVWGDASRRQDAKAIGHGWNYGMGLDGLARNAGVPEHVAAEFDHTMRERFPGLVAWREHVRDLARSHGVLDNGFGRLMRCNPARAHTQAPALMGQGTARDLMMECLLRLPDDIARMIRIQVHDEVVLEVPENDVDEVAAEVLKAMTFQWAPPGASRPITVHADVSGSGRNWADCYTS